jgi:RNA polymerase sigma factor (sigma-70 family)
MTRLTARQSAAALDRFRPGGPDDLPDADLLDRFARYADHPAFEALLRRHGPMVFGVCRRVLANPADAEDAFQATFLVLVRKARAVRRGDRLGPWLYGVASRVAAKARAAAVRRAARTTEATDMLPDPTEPAPDWLPVLDAELGALPAKYRDPLVLCELQGASRADAARALGVPEGTLSSRLARGRDLLRRRLLKHGTLLPAGGLGVLFTAGGLGRAAVPAGLLARTAEVAAVVATGMAPAGAVPAGAARLTDEVLKGMFLTKLRAAGGALLALGLLTAGAAAGWPGGDPAGQEKPKPAAKAADAKPQPVKPGADRSKAGPDRDTLQGLWHLTKYDLPPKVAKAAGPEVAEMFKHIRLVVDGDTWWMVCGPQAQRHEVTLNAGKNPKWIDAPAVKSDDGHRTDLGIRGIYRLTADDTLELCTGETDDPGKGVRPAEFGTDDDLGIAVMTFKRHPLPDVPADQKAAREKLAGDWTLSEVAEGGSQVKPKAGAGVRVTPHHLFLSEGQDWLAYTYALDTDKTPAWIDLTLVDEFVGQDPGVKSEPKRTPRYGVFHHGPDGTLQLSLGDDGGKRIARPLTFESDDKLKVKAWVLKRAGEGGRATKEAVVAPHPAPAPKGVLDEDVRKLLAAGDYPAAEKLLRGRLAKQVGVDAAETRLALGACLIELARGLPAAEANRLIDEAQDLLKRAADAVTSPNGDLPLADRVRARADVCALHALLRRDKPDELLAAAPALLDRHRGTVEELIVLSLMHDAFRQKKEDDKAVRVQGWMRDRFGTLKDKPGAFPAGAGEYSKAFWENVLAAPGPN